MDLSRSERRQKTTLACISHRYISERPVSRGWGFYSAYFLMDDRCATVCCARGGLSSMGADWRPLFLRTPHVIGADSDRQSTAGMPSFVL